MNPIISIILPFYNAGPYLRECVESIKNQDYRHWQLLAIDDCSNDNSLQIIKNLASNDSRISVLSNENKGLINALVLGEQAANGEFITRMDADDMMCQGRLSKMVKVLMNKPGHVAVGLVEYFRNDQDLGGGYKKYQEWLNSLTRASSNFSEIYKECSIPSPCWMMHRADFMALGGFGGSYPEDYDLAFRMKLAKMKVEGIDQVLLKWRDHSSRASRNDDNYADNRFLQLKIKHFLEQENTSNLGLWGAGKKGKQIAALLNESGIAYSWYTNNLKKIGKEIYGVTLEAPSTSLAENVIVAVANDQEQNDIRRFFKELKSSHEYHFFC